MEKVSLDLTCTYSCHHSYSGSDLSVKRSSPETEPGELLFTERSEPGRSQGQARGGHGGQPQGGRAPGQALPSYQDSWDEFDSVLDESI